MTQQSYNTPRDGLHGNIQRKEEPHYEEQEKRMFPCQNKIWFVLAMMENGFPV